MKKILPILLLALPLCLGAKTKYDVYLCIGQSNMAGRGEMLPGDRQPLEGVFILGQDDVPVPACAPLNQYSTIRKKKSIQGLNPAWSFARKMYRETGRPLLLVVNAKGGTSIDLWTKTAPCDTFRTRRGDEPELNGTVTPQFYSEAVRRTREAMKYGRLKGILWHQGESDSGSQESRDAYMAKLSGLVSDIRKDLGRKVPFVAGEVYEKGVSRAINPVLDGISGYIPKSCCVSSAGLPSKKDNVHFNRESQIELGERYADAFLHRRYRARP